MSNTFSFDNISGQPAAITINERGNHINVMWGGLEIADISGQVGFWEGFHKTPGSFSKGAARESSLRSYAKKFIEEEIYQFVKYARDMLGSCNQ